MQLGQNLQGILIHKNNAEIWTPMLYFLISFLSLSRLFLFIKNHYSIPTIWVTVLIAQIINICSYGLAEEG